ncbi:MAG: DNA double-strand break repair nuclease NurA [Bacillota bacterium]
MLEITSNLKESLQECNQQLREKYNYKSEISEARLRELITKQLGTFNLLAKLEQDDLKTWTESGSIIGVDGSVNTMGKVFPHYLTLLQALAKNTVKSEEEIVSHEVFSPLIESDKEKIFKKLNKEGADKDNAQEVAGKIRTSLLAALEVEVAKKSIRKWQPKLIIMDGSLSRYKFQAEESWEQLVELAIREEVLLVGVIEEIATHKISETLKNHLPSKMHNIYDRELLFGLLELGEMLTIEDINLTQGFKKSFLRSARDPGVIGLDMIEEQQSALDFVAQVVYTLTPQDGRGIPIWLDIVDNEVRISNKMMDGLVDNYLDPDLKQKLFHSKRSDRVY